MASAGASSVYVQTILGWVARPLRHGETTLNGSSLVDTKRGAGARGASVRERAAGMSALSVPASESAGRTACPDTAKCMSEASSHLMKPFDERYHVSACFGFEAFRRCLAAFCGRATCAFMFDESGAPTMNQ